jgi:hypothetical protein
VDTVFQYVPPVNVAGRCSTEQPGCCPRLEGLLKQYSSGNETALAGFFDATIDTLWPLVVQRTGCIDHAEAVIRRLYSRVELEAPRWVANDACTWSLILAATRHLTDDVATPSPKMVTANG